MGQIDILTALQTHLREVVGFAPTDVALWSFDKLDGEMVNCPYIILAKVDVISHNYEDGQQVTTYEVPALLVESFYSYESARGQLAQHLDTVLDYFTSGAQMSLGINGVNVEDIRSTEEVEIFPFYQENTSGVDPTYLARQIVFTITEIRSC